MQYNLLTFLRTCAHAIYNNRNFCPASLVTGVLFLSLSLSPEEAEEKGLVLVARLGGLGLQLAEQLLPASVGVHGGQHPEDGLALGQPVLGVALLSPALDDAAALEGAPVAVAVVSAEEAEGDGAGGGQGPHAKDGQRGGEGAGGAGGQDDVGAVDHGGAGAGGGEEDAVGGGQQHGQVGEQQGEVVRVHDG